MSNITLYFDGLDASMPNYATVFDITAGTAKTTTL
jgi:hypothetical protein